LIETLLQNLYFKTQVRDTVPGHWMMYMYSAHLDVRIYDLVALLLHFVS